MFSLLFCGLLWVCFYCLCCFVGLLICVELEIVCFGLVLVADWFVLVVGLIDVDVVDGCG